MDIALRKVGLLKNEPEAYIVYSLVYKTRSISPHGGERILIFSREQKYLGQYSVDTPPFRKASIVGSKIKFNDTPDHGNVIELGVDGPPSHVYLMQEDEEFFK